VRKATAAELSGFRPNRFALIEERLVKDGTFVFAGGHCADERQRELPWERPQGHAYEFDRLAGLWVERGGADADMSRDEFGGERFVGDEQAFMSHDGSPRAGRRMIRAGKE
jgi:hypothetical protein